MQIEDLGGGGEGKLDVAHCPFLFSRDNRAANNGTNEDRILCCLT